MPKKRTNNYKQLTIEQHIAMGSLRQNATKNFGAMIHNAIEESLDEFVHDMVNPKPTLLSILLNYQNFNPPTESKQWKTEK